jgi:hypothetical protein
VRSSCTIRYYDETRNVNGQTVTADEFDDAEGFAIEQNRKGKGRVRISIKRMPRGASASKNAFDDCGAAITVRQTAAVEKEKLK